MSFTETSNPLGNVQIKKETYDLPASGTGYSSVIDDLGPNANQNLPKRPSLSGMTLPRLLPPTLSPLVPWWS